MLTEEIMQLYKRFRLINYRKMFSRIRERDGSLSAMEAISLEVINMLSEPTVGQFADFLNISQSNATYKVNNLIKKGYLERQNSQSDRREYHLVLSEKYYSYECLMSSYEQKVAGRIRERFSPEELEIFDRMLETISKELMTECE